MNKALENKIFKVSAKSLFKFVVFSSIGIFVFFIPITIGDKNTIFLDHLVKYIKDLATDNISIYIVTILFLGAIYPFYNKTWNKSIMNKFFSIAKIFGFFIAIMVLTSIGPQWLLAPNMAPFLYYKLVIPVGVIVPAGAIFLAFLINFGLLEFIGTLMRPIMRTIWKTSGRSAIDAVASFVGSYSIGLLITDAVYTKGEYTSRDAAIIATGFSTVSVTFMIIVAKTLGLLDIWNFYFWTTLIITFLVTAITVRIYPLSKKSNNNYFGKPIVERKMKENALKTAFKEGLKRARKSKSLPKSIFSSLLDGIKMEMAILPSILSIGLLGLILANLTPLFDLLGYIFYPLTLILALPDPMLAAKASSMSITEMFLPALLAKDAQLLTKYVIGVVSVSSILFFSASIPCIISTKIPISIKEILIIWFQRVVFSLILAAFVGHLFL